MRGSFSVFLSLTAVASTSLGEDLTCRDLFRATTEIRAFEASTTLSQKVRDNAPDYWAYSREHGPEFFPGELEWTGLVVRDPHPGNFVLAPLNGRLVFYITDIKDSGTAPFILDLARLVMTTHAIFARESEHPKLRKTAERLLKAYVAGLRGDAAKVPDSLRIDFSQTMAVYRSNQASYVENRTAYDRFSWKQDKIAPLESDARLDELAITTLKQQLTDVIAARGTNAEVLDFALRPRERGGSRDLARYWVLIREAGETKIVEFKEVGDPATESYASQAQTVPRYESVMQTFWQARDPEMSVVTLGSREFVMRPKKLELLGFSYSPDSSEKQQKLIDLSAFVANYLGRLHGRQLEDRRYSQHLEKNRDDVIESLRDFTKAYMRHLEGEL